MSDERTQIYEFLGKLAQSLPPEAKSPQSDLTVPNYRSEAFYGGYSAVCLLLYLGCIGVNPIQEEELRDFFWLRAARREKTGYWPLVTEICELETWTPFFIIQAVLRQTGPWALFGNVLPDTIKIARKVRWKKIYQKNTRPVRRKVRKRGYDDKGHLGKNRVPLVPEVIGPEPRHFFSKFTRFFDSLPNYRRRNSDVSRASGQDPTLGRLAELNDEIETQRMQVHQIVQGLRTIPAKDINNKRRKIRRSWTKLYRAAASLETLLVERNELENQEPLEVPDSSDVPSQTRVVSILAEAWNISSEELPGLLQYYEVSADEILPRT